MKRVFSNKVLPFIGLLNNLKSDFGLILALVYSVQKSVDGWQIGYSWQILAFPLLLVLFILILLLQSIFKHCARRTVSRFYKHLQDKSKIEKAWKLLSKEIVRQRWDGNNGFKSFKNGFKYTKGIDIKSISFLKKEASTYDFTVIYVDKVESPGIFGLTAEQQRKIGEIGDLKEYIDKLCLEFKSQGLDETIFKSIPLYDFFQKNFSDTVRWKYEIDVLKNVENNVYCTTFLSVKIVSVVRRYKWFIYPYFKIDCIDNASNFFRIEDE